MARLRGLFGHLQGRGVRSSLKSGRVQGLLHSAAVSHGLVRVGLLVVLFVQNDASEGLIDPGRPLVETLVDLLTLLEQLVPVERHYALRAWVAQNERQDRHFEEFALGFLACPPRGLARGRP